jgi:hypothetical protein
MNMIQTAAGTDMMLAASSAVVATTWEKAPRFPETLSIAKISIASRAMRVRTLVTIR